MRNREFRFFFFYLATTPFAGVLLAFAIPFHKEDDINPSFKWQSFLHKPVAFVILPIFALANTAIIFHGNLMESFSNPNSIGIITGLLIGKFAGIFFFSFVAVRTKFATISADLNWRYILGVSFLGGIGFTMSIFITNLAFEDGAIINESKISILLASLLASATGLLFLKSNPRAS